jgi:hypothetical protein
MFWAKFQGVTRKKGKRVWHVGSTLLVTIKSVRDMYLGYTKQATQEAKPDGYLIYVEYKAQQDEK